MMLVWQLKNCGCVTKEEIPPPSHPDTLFVLISNALCTQNHIMLEAYTARANSITVYCFPAKQKSSFEIQQMELFQLAALYLR